MVITRNALEDLGPGKAEALQAGGAGLQQRSESGDRPAECRRPEHDCSPSLSLGFLSLQIWRWVCDLGLYGSQSL